MTITRRGFVGLSLAGLGVALTGAALWPRFGFGRAYDLRRFVLEQFRELTDEELQAFAVEYQTLYAGEAQTEALLQSLRGDAKVFPESLHEWRERYRRKIRRDFESDQTVPLRDWILSRTEASMLCLCWRFRRPSSDRGGRADRTGAGQNRISAAARESMQMA